MDIDKDRLDAVYKIGRRYADEMDINLKMEKTVDRRESLKDADFVVNTALVVGYRGYREGWSVGLKRGYRFGGSYHVMHDEGFWINFYQLRLFEALVNDIRDICPDAWYIKLANPVLAGTTYLARKHPRLKFVGLCHGFSGVYHLADVLGIERDRMNFQIPGVNHFVWLRRFSDDGEDAYPLLDDWIANEAGKYWERCRPSDDLGPKAIDLYKRFGVFPIGDTCTPGGGSWPWWYHVDDQTEKRWREDPRGWWSWVLEPPKVEGVSEMMKAAEDRQIRVTDLSPAKKSGEIIIPLVESIACDVPRTFQVNMLNREGFVPGIPDEFEVEIPARVSHNGVKGIRTEALPKPVINFILRDRVAPVELELEAYETGSRERLLDCIMMDPWTRSVEQARGLMDDILALPAHEEMRRHYV